MARRLRIDMAGLRFGRLVGVAYSHTSAGGRAHWLFACDCGGEVIADGGNVRAGSTASCGCLHREVSAARLLIHGHRAGGRHGATYRAWQAINTACANPASPRFRDFGARGIAVTPAWASDFRAFLDDMGERPPGTMLARIDAAAGFSPANCVWAPARSRVARRNRPGATIVDAARRAPGHAPVRAGRDRGDIPAGLPSTP